MLYIVKTAPLREAQRTISRSVTYSLDSSEASFSQFDLN